MKFTDFDLIEPLQRAIVRAGYADPTPIQRKALPDVLAGRDLLGCAQTGTGKTAAFALPILQRLYGQPVDDREHRPIRALVLTPTRELAAQVGESFGTYGRYTSLRHTVVHGGVHQGPQVRALTRGVDIIVATPGRLLDLMGQGRIKLERVEVFVLDEADRMLDMGFIDDIRKIVAKLPRKRQTLLFSATIPQRIRYLAEAVLTDPVEVRVRPEAPAAETVDQIVYLVERVQKQALLEHLLVDESIARALVFTRTKLGADRVALHLKAAGIDVDVIHSNRTQKEREAALAKFKQGGTRVLVASDIAARGLDVDDISHVINFDMPTEAEVYVHRIGRTGRAGAAGMAFSFCDVEERSRLDEIEELLGEPVPTEEAHPFVSPLPRRKSKPPEPEATPPLRRSRRPGRRRRL